MGSKYVTLEYDEYINVYRYWKEKINPSEFTCWPWAFLWERIGLHFYDSSSTHRKFKILDHSKWMQHWTLVKINPK